MKLLPSMLPPQFPLYLSVLPGGGGKSSGSKGDGDLIDSEDNDDWPNVSLCDNWGVPSVELDDTEIPDRVINSLMRECLEPRVVIVGWSGSGKGGFTFTILLE